MSTIHTNGETSWFILHDRHIFCNLYDLQFTTKYSTTIDALVKAGCTTQQIYSYFQNIGINVYEDHIKIYIKNGINNCLDSKPEHHKNKINESVAIGS